MRIKTTLTALLFIYIVIIGASASPTIQVERTSDLNILSSFENAITTIVDQC